MATLCVPLRKCPCVPLVACVLLDGNHTLREAFSGSYRCDWRGQGFFPLLQNISKPCTCRLVGMHAAEVRSAYQHLQKGAVGHVNPPGVVSSAKDSACIASTQPMVACLWKRIQGIRFSFFHDVSH